MIQQLASSSEKLQYDHGILPQDQSEKVMDFQKLESTKVNDGSREPPKKQTRNR